MTAKRNGAPSPGAIFLLALLCFAFAPGAPVATAADTTITLRSVGHADVDMNAPLEYTDAVKIALTKSESLRTTKIDLESSKINETTMWYRLFPKLNLLVNYDIPAIKNGDSTTTYKESVNVSFSTGTYDPISAYIAHDASKMSVKLSEMLHVIAIQDMLQNIGEAFISIDAMGKEIAAQEQLVSVMESLVKFTGRKYSSGSLASLDYKMAEQRLAMARMEMRRAYQKRERYRKDLKQLIGLDRYQNVVFKTAGYVNDIPAETNLDQVLQPQTLMKRNLNLRAQTLRTKLEKYNISLAQAEHIPKFTFGFRTPDPLSNQQGNLPYYASIQATVPIWAWGETMRNEERARLKVQDSVAQSKLLQMKLQQKADELRDNLDAATMAASLAQSKVELLKLEAKRKEISFGAGNTTFQELITTKEAVANAQIDAIRTQQALSVARLGLKVITGDLINEYVRVDYGELEKE